jgi:demethylmenaquinone methyltransferase/2-methoxy-6-polyprenyl-1,4-benzoquinol methylase
LNNPPGNQEQMIDIYRQRAKDYDDSGISGLEPWRKEAVRTLNLKRGDRVVDIGCGTGLNFALLQEAVGPEGKIIGVDLTDAMLDQAREVSPNTAGRMLNWCKATRLSIPSQTM